VWLPHALDSSADRYGSIGVAFTYLAASVLGQVIATDTGWFGQWIRGERGKA
jgi:membrane protein